MTGLGERGGRNFKFENLKFQMRGEAHDEKASSWVP
jgi:hypothetical protein